MHHGDSPKAASGTRSAWSGLNARVSNRLARHLRPEPHQLRNAGPMVSFTFDDVPQSAATVGVPVLNDYNAKGTFYVSGSLVGQQSADGMGISSDEIVALHRAGHEIACHTYSHVITTDLDAAALAEEIEENRRYFLALDPSIKIENFAYPYGFASIWRKDQLSKTFHSSRGILPGVNRGTVDLHFLRATPLIDKDIDRDGIDRVFDEAVAKNGWLIFYGHDVAETPSPYGCSPALLRYALDAASRRNMPMLSVADALRRAGL